MRKPQGRAYGYWVTEEEKAGFPGHKTNSMTRKKKENDQQRMHVLPQATKESSKSTVFTSVSFQSCGAARRFSQGLFLLCLMGLAVIAQGATDEEMTMKGNPLLPCPDSPNCVSTIDAVESHAIAPYRYRKSLDAAKSALKQIFSEFPRTQLVKEEEANLHFEVRSFLLQFVDDVEFWFDAAAKTIHFRSASRSGYYDFGVNRKRMEELRRKLEGKL